MGGPKSHPRQHPHCQPQKYRIDKGNQRANIIIIVTLVAGEEITTNSNEKEQESTRTTCSVPSTSLPYNNKPKGKSSEEEPPITDDALKGLLQEVLQNEGSTALDHLANERTYLAGIQTALSISGVSLGLLQWKGVANSAGYLVLSLGILALISSTMRYLTVMRKLSQGQFEPNVRDVLAMVKVILIVIVVLLVLQATHNLWSYNRPTISKP